MGRRVVNLTLDTLSCLPADSRSCVAWELEPVRRDELTTQVQAEAAKEQWLSQMLLDWGSCGKVVFSDGDFVGFVTYAPPAYVPRAESFGSGPVSDDAALLMTALVVPEFVGGGFGRVLVQSAAKDLSRRGIRAIEAFGDVTPTDDGCVLPADFLLAVGFKTVRPHARYPRLRMDFRTALTWREDVEGALERLLGSISSETASLRPI